MPISRGMITLKVVSDGAPGSAGTPGYGYTLNILGGTRGISYSAAGTLPQPATSTAFSVQLLENGSAITPYSYSWTCGGSLSGTSTSATFTPVIASTAVTATASFVQVVVKKSSGSADITTNIPIVITKNADGLDWINDWNGNQTVVGSYKLISPRIFAGTNDANGITGVALGVDALTGSKMNGIVGYQKNIPKFLLDTAGNFLVTSNAANGATDVVNGAGNGLYFDGTNLHISGNVYIRGGSVPSGVLPGEVVNGALDGSAANSLTQSWTGNGTMINGAMIQTGTINANTLNLKGQLSIVNNDAVPTFVVDNDGNVEVSGWLHSANFDDSKNLGYSINRDGEAVFNQVIVRGDVILPDAGVTNYGNLVGNSNYLKNSDFSSNTLYWSLIKGTSQTGVFSTVIDPFLKEKVAMVTKPNAVADWYFNTSYLENIATKPEPNKTYTVSFYARATTNASVTPCFTDDTGVNVIAVTTTSITLSTTWKRYSYTFSTGATIPTYTRYAFGIKTSAIADFWFTKFKWEESTEVTPWCLADSEQGKQIRFWAGKSYSDRADAAFKVYNDGSVVATKGNWQGTVTGDLHVGKMHIHKDEFTLARNDVVVDAAGTVVEGDYKTNPYFYLSMDKTFINNNLGIGNDINYTSLNRLFNLYNQYFRLESFKHAVPTNVANGSTNIEFNPSGDNTVNPGLNIYDWGSQKHNIRLQLGGQALFFTNYSTKQGAKNADYCFSRYGSQNNAVVEVRGVVKAQGFVSPDHTIEMKSVVSATNPDVENGFGFFVV